MEENIWKIEEERKEIFLKIEEVYKMENDVIEERIIFEEMYLWDVSELCRNIEEEI